MSICFLTHCDRELPIEPPVYPAQTYEVVLGSDYRYQRYWDFESAQEVGFNHVEDWDIGWVEEGCYLVLNGARGMQLAWIDSFEVQVVPSTLQWRWDAPSGNLDSSAAGRWWQHKKAMVVDLGRNPQGQRLGYWKLLPMQCSGKQRTFRIATLDHRIDTVLTISVDTQRYFTAFRFSDLATPFIEPNKGRYDVWFTRYMETFITGGDTVPYAVVGVLLAPGVAAALDSIHSWEEITQAIIPQLNFSYQRNAIGFQWKYYDFNLSQYFIKSNYIYVIRTVEGNYFKLRFLDFYSTTGEKGTIRFMVQRL